MKVFQKKSILQKTIIIVLTVLCINFIVPTYSHADFGGVLMDPIVDFICSLGDAVVNLLQKCMTGDWGSGFSIEGGFLVSDDQYNWGSTPKDVNGEEITNSISTGETINPDEEFSKGWLGLDNHFYVPVATYSPEQIFSGNVSGLDINFVNPNANPNASKWGTTTVDGETVVDSSAGRLQKTIASWYVALRNLATVALLSILVYVGIRIIISSTASDKAKYKQFLMDWLIALLILFFLHYIMSFTITLVQSITGAINGSGEQSVAIQVTGKGTLKTNLLGAARFKTQYKDFGQKMAYCIMYLALVIYTVIFTWFYLKRLLTMAFLTIISPLVALTYPIDKMGDSKAQAFNSWLKEYVFNAMIQPFHLIIYMVFVGSAMDLATSNIIYMIAALGFILPAEKILRGFFGFNQASSTLGSLVGGAAIGSYLAKGAKSVAGGAASAIGSGKGSSGGNSGSGASGNKPVRFEKGHNIGQIDAPPSDYKGSGLPSGGGSGTGGGLPSGSGEEAGNSPNMSGIFDDMSQAGLTPAEELEYARLGAQLDSMQDSEAAWTNPQLRQEYEDAQRRYLELENKKKQEQEEKEQQKQMQQAQQGTIGGQSNVEEEKEAQEKLKNSPLKNWARARGITPRGIGKKATKGIGGAVKFATRTTFKAGAGTFAAAVALASGAGLAGGLAAFGAGAAVGGRAADAAIKVAPTVGKGAARTVGTAAGLAVAAKTGIGEAVRTGDTAAGLDAARNSKGMQFAKRSAFEGTALGREMDIANGNSTYKKAAALRSFKSDENNIQYLKDQMASQGWTDADGNEYAAGSIPSDADVRDKMDSFDDYILEGMTDVKQIMKAQKAEDYGVSAKQAAIISSIADEKGITEDVLNDEKRFNAKRNNLIHEHENKGFSKEEATRQADYILDVAKVQNGVDNNMKKVPKQTSQLSNEQEKRQKDAHRRAEKIRNREQRKVEKEERKERIHAERNQERQTRRSRTMSLANYRPTTSDSSSGSTSRRTRRGRSGAGTGQPGPYGYGPGPMPQPTKRTIRRHRPTNR